MKWAIKSHLNNILHIVFAGWPFENRSFNNRCYVNNFQDYSYGEYILF